MIFAMRTRLIVLSSGFFLFTLSLLATPAFAQSDSRCTNNMTDTTGAPFGSHILVMNPYTVSASGAAKIAAGRNAMITSICGSTIIAIQYLKDGTTTKSWTLTTDATTKFLGLQGDTIGASTLKLFSLGDYLSFTGSFVAPNTAHTSFLLQTKKAWDLSLENVAGNYMVTGTVSIVNAAAQSFVLVTATSSVTINTTGGTLIKEGNAATGYTVSSFASISTGETVTAIGVYNNLSSTIEARTVKIHKSAKSKFVGTLRSAPGAIAPAIVSFKPTAGGLFQVNIASTTVLTDKNGNAITINEMQSGDLVSIGGTVEDTHTSYIDADLIVDASVLPPTSLDIGPGTVESVATSSFVFIPAQGSGYPPTVQVIIGSTTVVKEGNVITGYVDVPVSYLAPGEYIDNLIGLYMKSLGTLDASKVKIFYRASTKFDGATVAIAGTTTPTTITFRNTGGKTFTLNITASTTIKLKNDSQIPVSRIRLDESFTVEGMLEVTNPSIIDVTTLTDSGPANGTSTKAKLGAFAWSSPRYEAQFASWLGKSPSIAVDYISATTTWAKVVANAAAASHKWSTQASQYQMTYGLAMLVTKGDTLAKGASGAYDPYFRQIAQTLIKNGEDNAAIRIGWEFNGNWYPWAAQNDPKSFVTYWRRIVNVMRSVPGENFTFDWNPSANWDTVFNPASAYPGDDVVDVIGIDFYDSVNTEPFGSSDLVKRWNTLISNPYSLNWISNFAALHNKPMAFDEWAVGCSLATLDPKNGCTAKSNGGDDPYFIDQMNVWIQTHNVLWQNYFNVPTYYGHAYHMISNGEFPLSGAAYIADFGPLSKGQ